MAEGDVSTFIILHGVSLVYDDDTPSGDSDIAPADATPVPRLMHLQFPLTIRGGEFVMVEQDSQTDIDGCLEAAARCPRGWLDSLPEMGLADYTLTRGTPPIDDIRAGIEPYVALPGDLLTDVELERLVATITLDPGAVT